MNSGSRVFLFFVVVLLISAVTCQREGWYVYPPSDSRIDSFNFNLTRSATITFVCPNGANLLLQKSLAPDNYFQADAESASNFLLCVMDFNDGMNGTIRIDVIDDGATGYSVSILESKLFHQYKTKPDFPTAVSKIGFMVSSETMVDVIFLGPSCGDGYRDYLQGENCDDPEDDRCVWCNCELSRGGYTDYIDVVNPSCVGELYSGAKAARYILASVLPVVCVILVTIIVLRVLHLKGIITINTKRQQNNDMERDIVRQRALEEAPPHVVVKLDA